MSKFVLTAELRLQAPSNTSQVVSQIQNQLKDLKVNVSIDGAKSAVSQINKVTQATKEATSTVDKMGEAFGVSLKRFTAFSIASRAIGLFTSKLSGAVDEAIAFQNEVVRIGQVTGKTLGELKGLTNQVTKLAVNFGVSSKEILGVATTLAQAGIAGKDLEVAINALAKTKLAPTFGDIQDTAEGAVAVIAQFGEGVGALERQLGSINKVSAEFAVESEDLIGVIRRTGGVFKASGGTLEELLALFTSVRATTRESAESIATGLRTIFTRIQRPATIAYLKELGVELTDLDGQFVGPYEAVKRLSEALGSLQEGDIKFIQVAEELGGFRQIGKVIPLLRQFSTAEKARQAALEGGISLDADVASAQQSLAVQFTKVREEFLALIRSISETESFQILVKTSLTFASALIKVADALKPLIPLMATFAAVKFSQNIGGFLSGIGAGFSNIKKKNAGGRILAFASGGLVPGSGNGDTVPAMLSPGEFVIRKSSVNSIGADTLHAMNSNKYAAGGEIKNQDTVGMAVSDDIPVKTGSVSVNLYDKGREETSVLRKKTGFGELSSTTIERKFALVDQKTGKQLTSGAPRKKALSEGRIPIADLVGIAKNFSINNTKSFNTVAAGYGPDINKTFKNSVEDGYKEMLAKSSIKVAKEALIDDFDGIKFSENFAVSQSELGNIFENMIDGFKGSPIASQAKEQNRPFDFRNGIKFGKAFSELKDVNFIDAKVAGGSNIAPQEFEKKVLSELASELIENPAFKSAILAKNSQLKSQKETDENISETKAAKKKAVTIKRAATGGGISGSDTVPALLTPGEFVVNKGAAQRIGYGNLNRMNKQGVAGFAKGGAVGIQKFAAGGGVGGLTGIALALPALQGIIATFGNKSKEASDGMANTTIALEKFGQTVLQIGVIIAGWRAYDQYFKNLGQSVKKSTDQVETNIEADKKVTTEVSKSAQATSTASKASSPDAKLEKFIQNLENKLQKRFEAELNKKPKNVPETPAVLKAKQDFESKQSIASNQVQSRGIDNTIQTINNLQGRLNDLNSTFDGSTESIIERAELELDLAAAQKQLIAQQEKEKQVLKDMEQAENNLNKARKAAEEKAKQDRKLNKLSKAGVEAGKEKQKQLKLNQQQQKEYTQLKFKRSQETDPAKIKEITEKMKEVSAAQQASFNAWKAASEKENKIRTAIIKSTEKLSSVEKNLIAAREKLAKQRAGITDGGGGRFSGIKGAAGAVGSFAKASFAPVMRGLGAVGAVLGTVSAIGQGTGQALSEMAGRKKEQARDRGDVRGSVKAAGAEAMTSGLAEAFSVSGAAQIGADIFQGTSTFTDSLIKKVRTARAQEAVSGAASNVEENLKEAGKKGGGAFSEGGKLNVGLLAGKLAADLKVAQEEVAKLPEGSKERKKLQEETNALTKQSVVAIANNNISMEEAEKAARKLANGDQELENELVKLAASTVNLREAQKQLAEANFDSLKMTSAFSSANAAVEAFSQGLATGSDSLAGYIIELENSRNTIGADASQAITNIEKGLLASVGPNSKLASSISNQANIAQATASFSQTVGSKVSKKQIRRNDAAGAQEDLRAALYSAIPENAGAEVSNQLRKVIDARLSQITNENVATIDISEIIQDVAKGGQELSKGFFETAKMQSQHNQKMSALYQQREQLEAKAADSANKAIDRQIEAAKIFEEFGGSKFTPQQEYSARVQQFNNIGGLGGLGARLTTGSVDEIQSVAADIRQTFMSQQQGSFNDILARGAAGAGGPSAFSGAEGVSKDKREEAKRANEALIDITKQRIGQIKEELSLIQKKNAEEKSAIDKLISGDSQGFFEAQAASAAASVLKSGSSQLAGVFSASQLGAGLKSLEGQGLSKRDMESAASTVIGRFGGNQRMAQVFAGTTAEENALNEEGRKAAMALNDISQQAAEFDISDISIQDATIMATNVKFQSTLESVSQANAAGFARGGVVYASRGMFVPRGTDTVPAMLTAGEFVVNRRAVQSGNNLQILKAMNNNQSSVSPTSSSESVAMSRGGPVRYYADGGFVEKMFGNITNVLAPVFNSFSESVKQLQNIQLGVKLDTTNVNVNFNGTGFLSTLSAEVQKEVLDKVKREITSKLQIGQDGKARFQEGVV